MQSSNNEKPLTGWPAAGEYLYLVQGDATGTNATYTAGRFTSTSTVDERFKTAARLCLTNLWRREQGGGTDTFGALPGTVIPGFWMPNAVLDLLANDIHAPEVL